MNRIQRIAKSLLAGDTISQDEYVNAFEKKGVKGLIALAKDNGGKINKYRLGDGWKKVIEFGKDVKLDNGGKMSSETSETCILYALMLFAKDKNFNYKDVDSEGTDGLKDWAIVCQSLPKKWSKKDAEKLVDDLEDVNYHDESSNLKKVINRILWKNV